MYKTQEDTSLEKIAERPISPLPLSPAQMKERLKAFSYPYKELMAYYRCAMMEVETKFRVLNEELSLQYDRNPIETVKTRLKSPESIVDKLSRMQLPPTLENIESNLNDIKKSILMYHDELGVEVQITEMAVRNYKAELEKEHGAFYQKLFNVFKSINRDQEEPILTNVAIWGLVDRPFEPSTSYGYRQNGTHGGLFGWQCTVKEAFLRVHEELAAD